jgi:hypothetical protein
MVSMSEEYSEKLPAGSAQVPEEVGADVMTAETPGVALGLTCEHSHGAAAPPLLHPRHRSRR